MIDSKELIPTRLSLLSRLKDAGDEEGWREFFETYWKLIYRFARKHGLQDADAQDVVQESILCIFHRMPRFEYRKDKCSFKSWLLGLTYWRILDHVEQKPAKKRAIHESFDPAKFEDLLLDEVSSDKLQELWDEEWERHVLDAAAERVKKNVDPGQYQLFELAVVKEWPMSKIAKTMGVNVGKVYLAKHRVSKEFKNEIQSLNQSPYQ